MTCNVYTLKVKGAPSLTGVIIVDDWIIHNISCIVKYVHRILHEKNIKISKMAAVKRESNHYLFKFFQIEKNGELFDNRDCGNSMMAAGIVVLKHYNTDRIELINIDTKLKAIIEKKNHTMDLYMMSIDINIDSEKSIKKETIITADERKITIEYINVLNPYVIVSASSLGLTSIREILKLRKTYRTDIYMISNEIRQIIAKEFNFSIESNLPKLAIVFKNNNYYFARTLYMDDWHSGLPITCMLTIAYVEMMHSDFNVLEKELKFISPSGTHVLKVMLQDDNSKIRCKIDDFELEGEIGLNSVFKTV